MIYRPILRHLQAPCVPTYPPRRLVRFLTLFPLLRDSLFCNSNILLLFFYRICRPCTTSAQNVLWSDTSNILSPEILSSLCTYQRVTVSIDCAVFPYLRSHQTPLIDYLRLRTSSARVFYEFGLWIYTPALPTLTKVMEENSIQT